VEQLQDERRDEGQVTNMGRFHDFPVGWNELRCVQLKERFKTFKSRNVVARELSTFIFLRHDKSA
jgi:hypothetical protein